MMELVLPLPAHSVEFRWVWSVWRRRKRAQARASRYRRRRGPPARAPDGPSAAVVLGKVFGFTCSAHNGPTFVQPLEGIDACYPTGRGHIACDNLSAHDADAVLDWFDDHPRWTRHFTPKHASWLDQIECMFSILAARVLARGSFTSVEDLEE